LKTEYSKSKNILS